MATKFCTGCELTQPLDAFQKCATRGTQSRCRTCRQAAAAEYRERNRERLRAANREYAARRPEVGAAYYAANRERLMAAMRERHEQEDADTVRAKRRAWYEANRERVNGDKAARRLDDPDWAEAERQRSREYYQRRPDKFLFYNARRRGLMDHPGAERIVPLVVLERDDGVCGICGDDVDPTEFQVDHIIPLSRGGAHTYANVQPAHPLCNKRKNARLPEEMAA